MRQCIFNETLIHFSGLENVSNGDNTNVNTKSARIKPICYFASKADQNTPFQDIVSHAKEAQERGWDVDLHLWDDTPHWNHLIRHNEEYVEAVKNI